MHVVEHCEDVTQFLSLTFLILESLPNLNFEYKLLLIVL